MVSGSFQEFDQSYLIAALKQLGANFVGVTQLPATTTDSEIIKLDAAGIRAVRFNLRRGGSESIEHLAAFGQRIYDLVGWHVECYVDSKDLEPLMPILTILPKVSIDHLGLSQAGLSDLLKLVEKGIKVKATGFMRVDFEVADVLKKIHSINPNTLMFGTDLPGTRAPRQFNKNDLRLINDNFSKEDSEKILRNNALELYGIEM